MEKNIWSTNKALWQIVNIPFNIIYLCIEGLTCLFGAMAVGLIKLLSYMNDALSYIGSKMK